MNTRFNAGHVIREGQSTQTTNTSKQNQCFISFIYLFIQVQRKSPDWGLIWLWTRYEVEYEIAIILFPFYKDHFTYLANSFPDLETEWKCIYTCLTDTVHLGAKYSLEIASTWRVSGLLFCLPSWRWGNFLLSNHLEKPARKIMYPNVIDYIRIDSFNINIIFNNTQIQTIFRF